MRLSRHWAGRSGKQIWRANRRAAFRAAWRLNLFSLALIVGCAIAISYYEGFGELIFAAIIGAMLAIQPKPGSFALQGSAASRRRRAGSRRGKPHHAL